MPFRAAHWYVLGLVGLTVLAFWPSYFGKLAASPLAFHLHGITAMLWILLLAAQSWTIHTRRRGLHRAAGLSSLALFPLFAASGLLVIQTMARATLAAADPLYTAFGAPLALYDTLATAGATYCYFEALRRRRTVALHAGYMLATALFLIGPVAVRLFGAFVPWLAIGGPDEFWLFGVQVHLANLLVVLLALGLARLRPQHAAPFIVVIAILVAQSATFDTVGRGALWGGVLPPLASVPAPLVFGFGLLVMVPVVLAGWVLGAPRRRAAAA